MRKAAPSPGVGGRQSADAEAGIPPESPRVNPFDDKYVRIGFIRKVYALLSVQLLITTAVVAAFLLVPELNKFTKLYGFIVTIVGAAGYLATASILICGRLERTFPINLFLLFLFIDFTVYFGVSCVLIILLFILATVAAIFPSKTIQMVYACGGAAIYSFYVVIDTQLIVGGKNRAGVLSPEDYIVGAMMLYVDATNFFFFILEMISQLKGDK
ncbi:protein lifeguard 3-like [Dermacentor andersoni]|uniref:protein lifeguard 3-like n=1 Tax=Dermacentor andersoni TaxID=34620 RepID=UPI0024171F81|nr:protein lifeguard 3-like [Dermacentor andersoni]